MPMSNLPKFSSHNPVKSWLNVLALPCLLCNAAQRQPKQKLCHVCWNNMPWLQNAFYIQQLKFHAVCHYTWPIDRLIHLYKYQGRLDLLPILSDVLLSCTKPDIQALVPVPLSSDRLKARGFNQSLLLAKQLAKHWQLPVWQPFFRDASIAQQGLTRQERLTNLDNTFSINRAQCRVIPRKVLLIDDVVTTGSTLIAMQILLHQLGVQHIECLVLAKA